MIGNTTLGTNPQYMSSLVNDRLISFVKKEEITTSGPMIINFNPGDNVYRIAVHKITDNLNSNSGLITLVFSTGSNTESLSIPLFGSTEHSYVTFDTTSLGVSNTTSLQVTIDSTQITALPIIVEFFCKSINNTKEEG